MPRQSVGLFPRPKFCLMMGLSKSNNSLNHPVIHAWRHRGEFGEGGRGGREFLHTAMRDRNRVLALGEHCLSVRLSGGRLVSLTVTRVASCESGSPIGSGAAG